MPYDPVVFCGGRQHEPEYCEIGVGVIGLELIFLCVYVAPSYKVGLQASVVFPEVGGMGSDYNCLVPNRCFSNIFNASSLAHD